MLTPTSSKPCSTSISSCYLFLPNQRIHHPPHHQVLHPTKPMRREGRQHGMVRTYRILPPTYNPRPNGRILNTIDSHPAAGLFVKVPTRPTNHSKFTGKCSRARCLDCHLHPANKSKDKTKGSNKIKSLDISGRQKVSWGVVDGLPAGSLSGVSATGLLDGLVNHDCDDDDVDEGLICRGLVPAAGDEEDTCRSLAGQDRCEHDGNELEFYKVGFELDHIEEGDWSLVRDCW